VTLPYLKTSTGATQIPVLRWTKRKENDRWPQGVPKLAIPTIGKEVPAGPNWLHEIRHDGYRPLVRRSGSAVNILTRGGYDWTSRYPAIVAAALRLPVKHFVLDGEGVVEGTDGVVDFHMLHSRKHDKACHLMAFDLMALGPRDLQQMPLDMRKSLFAGLLEGSAGGIVYAEHMDGPDGRAMFDAAGRMGLEGIVSTPGQGLHLRTLQALAEDQESRWSVEAAPARRRCF
jgi:ATP-dependent DNA ligase